MEVMYLKKIAVTILSAMLFLAICPMTSSLAVGEDFTDLPFLDIGNGSWYLADVYQAYKDGIMNGKSDTKFAPEDNVTLAEIAVIAAKVNANLSGNNPEMSARNGEKWYMTYVKYCYEKGIYQNEDIDNGNMKLEDAENWLGAYGRYAERHEVAAMLSMCDQRQNKFIPNPNVPLTNISDVANGNSAHADEILTLYRMGVAVGDDNMDFHPYDYIKRAEVAAMVNRLMHDENKIELPKGNL